MQKIKIVLKCYFLYVILMTQDKSCVLVYRHEDFLLSLEGL